MHKLARSLRKPWRHRWRSIVHGFERILAPVLTQGQWLLRRWLPQRPSGLSRPLRITLTSHPPRYGTLALTLKSLLNQSVRADEVVLWVYAPQAEALPPEVTRLQREGLRIERCPHDWRVYTKFIPALISDPQAIWVTADDDIRYPRDWLATLLAGHRAAPGAIVCRRAHLMEFDADGGLRPYGCWPKQTERSAASEPLFLTGVGGVLYPPGTLHEQTTDAARFLALSPNADDIWLNWMARLRGTPICRVGDDHEPVAWFGSRRVSLFRLNARGTNNDDCVERMVQAYGSDCLRERR
ncbi:MAG TPA: glycosyltransferase family A protein [Methylibium sp.]|nr:glycosyltransferase family A protein [Methylibium sp.]